jgi:hypothetical protein
MFFSIRLPNIAGTRAGQAWGERRTVKMLRREIGREQNRFNEFTGLTI